MPSTFHILAISGSLRAKSSNTALLEALASLAPANVSVTLYNGLADLPHFNPDVEERAVPPSVSDLRAQIGAADAVVICTPEYAHGLPGVLKNALDWSVGSVEFPGKTVALVKASARGTHAYASLTEILNTMSARIISEASLTIPVVHGADMATILADSAARDLLNTVLVELVAAHQLSA